MKLKKFTLLILVVSSVLLGVLVFSSFALAPLIAVAAALDSVNPCAISVLLITIAFLFSLGYLRDRIVKVGLAYISGLFVIYLAIGLGILQALSFFGLPHFMTKIGAVLLIVLGFLNIGEDYPGFPKLGIPDAAHGRMAKLMSKGSMVTAFGLGALVGLYEFPCTGGPYLIVLGLLHDTETFWPGVGYLIFYNLIFVMPLLVLLFIGSSKLMLSKLQELRTSKGKELKLWTSVIMICLGIIILLI